LEMGPDTNIQETTKKLISEVRVAMGNEEYKRQSRECLKKVNFGQS